MIDPIADTQDLIQTAVDQENYFDAAVIALSFTGTLHGDGTPFFERRGLALALLAMTNELRKRPWVIHKHHQP